MKSIYNRQAKDRLTFPAPGIKWAEEGLDEATYTGPLPFCAIGAVTHNRYQWDRDSPTLQVDIRDLPSVLKQGGKRVKVKSDLEKPAPVKSEGKDKE